MDGHSILEGAWRPRRIINRQDQIETIRRAIYDPGDECRLVIIETHGGYGKSRLAEEALRRVGNLAARQLYGEPAAKDDWAAHYPGQAVAAHLLDFSSIRLHAAQKFMEEVGKPTTWDEHFSFPEFTASVNRLRRLADYGAAYSLGDPATVKMEKDFWSDYEQASQEARLVIVLDTIEELATISSGWLLAHNLIQLEDTTINTQQWLLDCLDQGKFKRTTILLAGRPQKDKSSSTFEATLPDQFRSFFDLLRERIQPGHPHCRLIKVPLSAFSYDDMVQYFEEFRAGGATISEKTQKAIENLLANEQQMAVLYHYTGGQPVRLALYAELIIRDITIPPLLNEKLDEARARTKSDGRQETPELLDARHDIERQFTRLLFREGGDLYSQIMQALVRAKRGLTAELLHFYLDAPPDTPYSQWKPNLETIDAIEKELENIRQLTLYKQRGSRRDGVQDELYRIYAESVIRDKDDKKAEQEARQSLFKRLREYAEVERTRWQEARADLLRQDLEAIEVEAWNKISRTFLPTPSDEEQEQRNEVNEKLFEANLDYLYYNLMLNLDNFNETFYDLVNARRIAVNEMEFTIFQALTWRALHDPVLTPFIPLKPHPDADRRGESRLVVLRRAAEINDAASWIVRFFLRKEYKRAVELADKIEEEAEKLTDPNEYTRWTHTLSRAERTCWREQAQIYLGTGIEEAVKRLEVAAADLEQLRRADSNEVVFPERGKLGGERGFKDHPAYFRLILILANLYNNAGFGYATLYKDQDAVRAYIKGLECTRQLPVKGTSAQEATIRNNLARALAEQGKKRAIRVCRDALNLRIKLGDPLPVAYSLNTLGLIYNNLHQPQEAMNHCARALALTQRAGDSRAHGLILVQLGEAVRRHAHSEHISEQDKDRIYAEARRLLGQAHDIFRDSGAKGESQRMIEVFIETGCLYRDWMRMSQSPNRKQELGRQALHFLNEAAARAQHTNPSLELDAWVNIAWAYAWLDELDKTEEAIKRADKLIPPEVKLRAVASPAEPTPPIDRKKPHHFFKQLNKIYSLKGMLAFDSAHRRQDEIRTKNPQMEPIERWRLGENTPAVLDDLKVAAENYVQALGYSQLYSVNSVTLTIIYDDLYERMKRLNPILMHRFYCFQEEARKKYRTDEIKPEDFGNLSNFLEDCFGDYTESPQLVPGVGLEVN